MSEHHDQGSEGTSGLPCSPRTLRFLGVAAAAVALAVAAGGILSRDEHAKSVEKWTDAAALPTVSTLHPTQDMAGQELVLPGDVEAWYAAPVYARVSGYLKAWYFDFGARVTKGQVLAEIETPDLDAQLSAAKAKLKSVQALVKVKEAEVHFADTTFARWRDAPKGVVSVQERQAKQADYESAVARLDAARADVAVAQAEVDRLQALESFKRVLVPFDGVVTTRETDIGALINAGSGVGGGSGPELFVVADTHKMRVYVKVPQRMANAVHVGMKAELHLPQYPDKVFAAVVATTSSAINVNSRTLLVEMHAENADGLLQPGTFAQVHFSLPSDPNVLRIPTGALLFRQHGLEVAVVGPDNKIELKRVKDEIWVPTLKSCMACRGPTASSTAPRTRLQAVISCGSQANPPSARRRPNFAGGQIERKSVQATCLSPAPASAAATIPWNSRLAGSSRMWCYRQDHGETKASKRGRSRTVSWPSRCLLAAR